MQCSSSDKLPPTETPYSGSATGAVIQVWHYIFSREPWWGFGLFFLSKTTLQCYSGCDSSPKLLSPWDWNPTNLPATQLRFGEISPVKKWLPTRLRVFVFSMSSFLSNDISYMISLKDITSCELQEIHLVSHFSAVHSFCCSPVAKYSHCKHEHSCQAT